MIEIFYLILSIILFYIVSIIYKLDELDKEALINLLSVGNHFHVPLTFYQTFKVIYDFLMIPFRNNYWFSILTEGAVYSLYLYKKHPTISKDLNNKVYWANVFKKNNIKYPITIAYIKNNKFYKINNIEMNKMYLCKPIYGALGNGVFKIKGKDITENNNKYNDVIFQELLKDCINKKPRHFRYITFYDGEPFKMLELKSTNNDTVSNVSNGGSVTPCNIDNCDHLSYEENEEIYKMAYKLTKLHTDKYPFVFSIGWDIMLDCKNKNNVKSYCLEGNICHGSWESNYKSYEIIKESIDYYKNKFKHFKTLDNYTENYKKYN